MDIANFAAPGLASPKKRPKLVRFRNSFRKVMMKTLDSKSRSGLLGAARKSKSLSWIDSKEKSSSAASLVTPRTPSTYAGDSSDSSLSSKEQEPVTSTPMLAPVSPDSFGDSNSSFSSLEHVTPLKNNDSPAPFGDSDASISSVETSSDKSSDATADNTKKEPQEEQAEPMQSRNVLEFATVEIHQEATRSIQERGGQVVPQEELADEHSESEQSEESEESEESESEEAMPEAVARLCETEAFVETCDQAFDNVAMDNQEEIRKDQVYSAVDWIHLQYLSYLGDNAGNFLTHEDVDAAMGDVESVNKEEFAELMKVMFGNVLSGAWSRSFLISVMVPALGLPAFQALVLLSQWAMEYAA